MAIRIQEDPIARMKGASETEREISRIISSSMEERDAIKGIYDMIMKDKEAALNEIRLFVLDSQFRGYGRQTCYLESMRQRLKT